MELFSAKMEKYVNEGSDIVENIEDMELKAALESWKSKTFALTVPLRIIALRGSVPPSWIKVYYLPFKLYPPYAIQD